MSSVETRGRWSWLVNRLRCMTPVEVVHRTVTAVRQRAWRLRGRPLPQLDAADAAPSRSHWMLTPVGVSNKPYTGEAARMAAGDIRLFSAAHYSVGRTPNWNRCPLTGVVAPAVPSDTVSLSDRAQVGDIKFLWELNRHLHWVSLAQAHALTGDAQPLETLRVHLVSWLDQCPAYTGPNWTSGLEMALRLINWAVTWQLVGGNSSALFSGPEGEALCQRWLDSVQMHVLAIAAEYSRHSSANNHLIGELAGVFVAASTWPCWPRVRQLGAAARRELEKQILVQVGTDGVHKEQAFEYATFVYDFFTVVERAAAAQGAPMSAAYLDRMAAMCCFVRSVMSVGGAVPQVGDADGAQVLRLLPQDHHDPYASMLQKGARLFGRPDWVADLDDRGAVDAAWLYGSSDSAPASTSRQAGLSFPQGGYELFVSHPNTHNEVRGLVDVGPLGYLGIAAHGHADALQVLLSVGGLPVLVDSGTYAYWCEKPWRDYFRGTAAHNTVRVAEQDQSVSGGRFMWTRKARVGGVHVRRSAGGDLSLSAAHDGYSRGALGFSHQRTVEFDAATASLRVTDELSGPKEQVLELHWHVHPVWTAVQSDHTLMLQHGARQVVLDLNVHGTYADGYELALLSGQQDPPLGWYSNQYNAKQPCSVLRWRGRARAARLVTRLRCVQPSAPIAA